MSNFSLYINNSITDESSVPSLKASLASSLEMFSPENVKYVASFHSGIDGYVPTPLVELKSLSKKLGLSSFLVKDESKRFDCNAFKVLGGSFVLASYICGKLGLEIDENTYRLLCSQEYKNKLNLTFATATDGNHGRGVAWAANKYGQEAYVFMPEGSAQERLDIILKLGAHASITDMNYDDTVRYVNRLAADNGWVFVQDTAWDGYEEIPRTVLLGYTTIGAEICDKLEADGKDVPTHVFLQAGVGCFAGAIAGYLKARLGDKCPKIIIVEPDKADCHYRTALANDGKMHFVTGKMDSMMAGLCCGEPCTLSWDIIKNTATGYVSCSDEYTVLGMRSLAHPTGDDEPVVSGESGAVTTGVVIALMSDPALKQYKDNLGLDESSRVLVISTEGATDVANYERIVNTEC